jgi:hypothetical protein
MDLLRLRHRRYEGADGPVLSGFCVSPLGPDCDEFGDQPLAEIARVRVAVLPPTSTPASRPKGASMNSCFLR